jgi:hypothetical protein
MLLPLLVNNGSRKIKSSVNVFNLDYHCQMHDNLHDQKVCKCMRTKTKCNKSRHKPKYNHKTLYLKQGHKVCKEKNSNIKLYLEYGMFINIK